jgi:hypothetical protein
MRTLNRRVLPQGFFAEAQVHVGGRVEIDVATFEQGEPTGNGSAGGIAVQTSAPASTLVMPATFPDEIEVQVFDIATGATLVAAIELVSPGNKDRPDTRRSFAAKCAGYLQMGVGLAVVDIVTSRSANLHDDLIDLLEKPAEFRFPGTANLYAVAYRPTRLSTGDQIEIQTFPLGLGRPLPTVPLALRGARAVPLELEATYAEVCRDSRL